MGDDTTDTWADVQHVISYLRDSEGAESEARVMEWQSDVLRRLVGELEGCDLTGPDEDALAPVVAQARRLLGLD